MINLKYPVVLLCILAGVQQYQISQLATIQDQPARKLAMSSVEAIKKLDAQDKLIQIENDYQRDILIKLAAEITHQGEELDGLTKVVNGNAAAYNDTIKKHRKAIESIGKTINQHADTVNGIKKETRF